MATTAIEQRPQTDVARVERTRTRQTFRPNVDIIEREEELLVLADMPGAAADDVDINFENDTLTIFASVKNRRPDTTRFLANEYSVGDYLRTFRVGEVIDTERITADMKNGVLTVHLPKTERVKPKKIAVTPRG